MAQRATVIVHYRPAHSITKMQRDRQEFGVDTPSKNKSMREFLVSEQLEIPVAAAGQDIAQAARVLSREEINSDWSTDAYVNSIHVEQADHTLIAGNWRVTVAVVAHGGVASWGGFTDPESSHAAVVEFGNPAAPHSGRRILGRAGQPWHSERMPL
jgi:hypothetical protein